MSDYGLVILGRALLLGIIIGALSILVLVWKGLIVGKTRYEESKAQWKATADLNKQQWDGWCNMAVDHIAKAERQNRLIEEQRAVIEELRDDLRTAEAEPAAPRAIGARAENGNFHRGSDVG